MDRRELEAAAAANHYLRGLLAVPLGIVLISSGLGNLRWGPFQALWVVPAMFVLTGAAYFLLAKYYNDNYGRVVLKTGQTRTIVGTVAALAVMVGGPILSQAVDLPVNGLGLAWATAALGYYAVNVGLKPHHLLIWGSVLVASLVPLWGDPNTTNTLNVGLLIVGFACVMTGVLDHRMLVGTFGAPSDLGTEDSDVRI